MAQENLKKAIGVINSLVEQGEKSFADGFQTKDVLDFLTPALQAGSVDWKDALEEAKNRDEASNQEILDFVKSDLQLQNQDLEKKVESVVALLISIDNAILAFKPVAATPPVTPPTS